MTPTPVLPFTVAAMLVALLPSAPPAQAAPRPSLVRLEGCVVDDALAPIAERPLAAVAADGRVLATARSNRSGEFSVQVPATAVFHVRVGGAAPLPEVLQTSGQDVWMSWCLRESAD